MNNRNNTQIIKGLKSIYLHNSYIRNKRIKLQCDGHTNLIGGNGRGKTSMLNLLPVFAGISPERMVQKAGGKSSFLDFYLPNLQSMIVYEYIGHQGICCVVIYRHQNGTKLIYRFVQGAAEATLFAENMHELFEKHAQVNEIISELQLNKINVSKQLETVLDYRAVLHNDKDRFAHDKTLRNLAADYAMCGRQYTLRHLGELTRVPMSQINLIDKFKSMLVDAYLQDESAVVVDKGLTHTQNVNLIEDIKSLHAFIKESPKLEKGSELSANVTQTLEQLIKIKFQGQALTQQFEQDQKQQQQDHDAYLLQYEQDYKTLQRSITALVFQLTTQKSEHTAIKNQITHINQEEQKYQKLNINRMISDYNDLPIYQTRQHDDGVHLQRLKASAKELLDSHEQYVRQVEDKATQEKRHLELKKLAINNQRVELRDQQSNEEDVLRVQHHKELDTLLAKQAAALQTTFESIQQASRNVGAAEAYTVDEQQRIDLNKKLFKDKKQLLAEHTERYAELKLKVQDQNKKRAQAVTALERNKTLLTDEQALELQLREQLNNEGSLISFLRSHPHEDWKQHIGKLINPSLLLKRGLNPRWDTEKSQQISFFGLHLDTDKLSLPQEAETLDELKIRIERQVIRCEQFKADQVSLERKAAIAQQESEALDLEKITAEQQLKVLNIQLDELEASKESIEQQICLHINQRRMRATQLLLDAQQQQEKLRQQQKDSKENLQRHQDDAREVIKAKSQLRDQQFQDELQQIEQKMKQASTQCADKLVELIEARDHALQAEGLDSQQLNNAEQRLLKAQQLVETVNGYISVINAYHHWENVDLSQRNDLLIRLDTLQAEVDDLNKAHQAKADDLKKLDEEKTSQISCYDAMIKTIQHKMLKLTGLLQRLTQPLSEFSDQEEALAIIEPEMPLDFDWYISHGQEQLAQLEQIRLESLKLHLLVKQILSLAQGNGLERYWSNRMVDSPHRLDSLPYVLQAMSVLAQMLKHEIPSKIEATIMTYQSLGVVFKNHYDALKRFQRKVSRVSDDLSSNINAHNPFTALSDIEVRLEASINKFGYLSDLENFVNRFETDSHALPNEHLLTLLESSIKALHNANADSQDLKSMVEMSICFKENNRLVRVKNDRDLSEASSQGLSRLVILLIFTGLIRHLCQDENVAIHLPIDELGQIDPSNSIKLLALMQQQQVHLVCAQPQMTEEIGKSFAYKYNIDKDKGVSQFVVKSKTQQNPLLVAGRNA